MVPSPEEFAEAIATANPSPIELAMLQWHYKAPGRTLTAASMSDLMGWSGQAANAQYGKFAARVAAALDWTPNPEDAYWDGMKVSCLVIGGRTDTDYQWTLRPEVAQAMEEMQIAPLDADVTAARVAAAEQGDGPGLVAEGRRVWIKSFWGFSTEEESYLGFSREADRKRLLDLYKPGDVILIYGAVAAETAADDRRQALGFLEIDPVEVTDVERSTPEALAEKRRRGWADKWIYAVPVRRAWEVKRRIEIRHIATTTYKYQRARVIATQGELLTAEEASFALSLPVSPMNVYLEPKVTDADVTGTLSDFLNPSRGIKPSFGSRTADIKDGQTFLYLMEMAGDIANVLPRDRTTLYKKILVKVGISNDPTRRLAEMNSGLPPNSKLGWKLTFSQPFPGAEAAFEAENQAKADLARVAESLGGEFFLGHPDKLHPAYHTAAGRAAFHIKAPPAKIK